MSLWLPILLIALGIGVTIVWRALQFRRLTKEGVCAAATITKSARLGAGATHMSSGRITYRYTGPDGREYSQSSSISEEKWAELKNRQQIEIVYLPATPRISAPAWVVDEARAALQSRTPDKDDQSEQSHDA